MGAQLRPLAPGICLAVDNRFHGNLQSGSHVVRSIHRRGDGVGRALTNDLAVSVVTVFGGLLDSPIGDMNPSRGLDPKDGGQREIG